VGYGGKLNEESKHDTKKRKREGGLIFVGSCVKCARTVVKKKQIQTSNTTQKKHIKKKQGNAMQCWAGKCNPTKRREREEANQSNGIKQTTEKNNRRRKKR
jgi:hypothetical protein